MLEQAKIEVPMMAKAYHYRQYNVETLCHL